MHLTGEGPGAILRFEAFLSFINRLLFMGSQRVRHDWATELNWTEWLYNIQLKTSRRALSLPPSEAYVRSFLYLLYTLIKLYYTKALSDQASSLAPDWILLLRGPRILASWFNNNLSVVWTFFSIALLGTGMKHEFSSCVATAEFSKFSGIFNVALLHHLLRFKIAQLEFHHLD